MSKSRLITLSIPFAGFLLLSGAALPVSAQEPGVLSEGNGPHPETYPIPDGVVFRKVVVSRDGTVTEQPATANDGEVSGEPGEKLIYSNTLGAYAINFPNNQPISDDISTTAPDGCNLIRYKFRVLGKVNPTGSTGTYTVNYGLYTNCPLAVGSTNATRDLVRIPGTEGAITFPDDAPREIEHLVPFETPVVLPANLYLSIRFNRTNCGTVVGAPPTLGFSGDIWDFPGFPCIGYLGGYPQFPHASMWLEMYGAENCAEAFTGYKSYRPSGGTALLGADIQGVDDVTLQVEDCQMVGYEVAVRGTGFYTFDLRRACDGQVIEGTERNFILSAVTQPQLQMVRFTFDPPISLNTKLVFLAFKSSLNSSGAVVAGVKPVLGESSTVYFIVGQDGCSPVFPNQGVHGAINLAITCAGTLPRGACCDVYRPDAHGEVSCRELPAMNCPKAPEGHWLEGQYCNDEPFAHPCGQGACCVTDHGCEDLTAGDCGAREPALYARSWLPDKVCADQEPSCSAGDCAAFHESPGCSDHECENLACFLDSWCCGVEWDVVCAGLAADQCDSGPRNDACRSSNGVEPDRSAMRVGANSTTLVNTENVELSWSFICPFESSIPGSLWFRFTAISETARISTCESAAPMDFRHLKVYQAPSGMSLEAQCSSLVSLACIQDVATCANGRNSDWCMYNLTPGQDYFVQLGLDYDTPRGVLRLDIESPCPSFEPRTSIPGVIVSQDPNQISDPFRSEIAASTVSTKQMSHLLPIAPIAITSSSGSDSEFRRVNQVRGVPTSVQVNVDSLGNNIVGDAANEPSIAVDPTNPNRMAIGWRQFNNPQTDRQAGWAYSHDGGATWTFPGVLDPGVFRSDPVLESDADGVFYYHSIRLQGFGATVYRSFDGGMTWDNGFEFGGGDKPWIAIDKTPGMGRGNLYSLSTYSDFQRGRPPHFVPFDSVDFGSIAYRGTMDVDSFGTVWIAENESDIIRVTYANRNKPFFLHEPISPFGTTAGPNPDGISGQAWIVSNPIGSRWRRNIYLLNGKQVHFSKSIDYGRTWSGPFAIHGDPSASHAHWFGTMSVAPSGRIDVVWNDTRNSLTTEFSELFYSFSEDEGESWSAPVPVSPSFDTIIGWPGKLGDYYDMASDGKGVHVAYAATFNGEHDVYYLRLLPPVDCNKNGVYDPDDIAGLTSADTNNDDVPDECQSDFDSDGLLDDIDPDIDDDGVANGTDFCLFTRPGEPVSQNGAARTDTNENCSVDVNDLWRFQYCMAGGIGFIEAPETACLAAFDRDQDQDIDLRDFAVFQNAVEP